MRFFVALLPPPDVVHDLAVAIEAQATAPGADFSAWTALRWTAPSSWHVTLAFLGPVDPAARPRLVDRLARVARRHAPVELRLAGVGHFGGRVLWARISGELGPLATGVRRAAVRAGAFEGDDRPLRAHLTLARVPEASSVELGGLVRVLDEAIAPATWSAATLTLMGSSGGPRPAYSVEGEWALRGSAVAR